MNLGYRCSLLYKAFWGEEEEKNPCSRCLFEENGEMCDECVISQRIRKKEGRKQTKEEVQFKRADELLIERFKEWLRKENYSETTIQRHISNIKRIFREIGFPTLRKFDSRFGLLPNTAKRHLCNTYYRFQDFLRSSAEEKRKEVKECELSK